MFNAKVAKEEKPFDKAPAFVQELRRARQGRKGRKRINLGIFCRASILLAFLLRQPGRLP